MIDRSCCCRRRRRIGRSGKEQEARGGKRGGQSIGVSGTGGGIRIDFGEQLVEVLSKFLFGFERKRSCCSIG